MMYPRLSDVFDGHSGLSQEAEEPEYDHYTIRCQETWTLPGDLEIKVVSDPSGLVSQDIAVNRG